MGIEAKARFLNIFPTPFKGELQSGQEFPGDVIVDWQQLALGVVTLSIFTYGLSAYAGGTDLNAVKVLDEKTLEVGKSGGRITYRGEEINNAKLSTPTLIPGLRLHYRYRD